jgi:acyl dehydratase
MLYYIFGAFLLFVIVKMLAAKSAIAGSRGKPIALKVQSLWSTGRLFGNLLFTLPFKKSGVAAKNFPPSLDVSMENYKFDKSTVSSYRKVCGFLTDGTKPVPVLCAAMPVVTMTAMSLAEPGFPLLALGCIHVRQKITVFQRFHDNAALNYRCFFSKIEDTEKGTEVTIGQIVSLAADPKVIALQGEMTFLSRGRGAGKQASEYYQELKDGSWPDHSLAAKQSQELKGHTTTINIPAYGGRNYAAVSGDYNPIHLHAMTSKLFGFKKPIIHGFWTMSRVLAELDKNNTMPAPFTMQCRFLTPLFLPSEVDIIFSIPSKLMPETETEHARLPAAGLSFEVRNKASRAPHLSGTFMPSAV